MRRPGGTSRPDGAVRCTGAAIGPELPRQLTDHGRGPPGGILVDEATPLCHRDVDEALLQHQRLTRSSPTPRRPSDHYCRTPADRARSSD